MTDDNDTWVKSWCDVWRTDLDKFNVYGSVHRKYISIFIQQDATLHILFYLETSVHVSSGTTTHHQERIQMYLQHLVFVTPLLLSAAFVEKVAVTVWQIPDSVDTVVCTPDDGWRYHSKHVEQFPDIKKLCKAASCWIYIGIDLDKWRENFCDSTHL
jgi:hypothetical protein